MMDENLSNRASASALKGGLLVLILKIGLPDFGEK
jgi:hypothetical protein